MRWRCRGGHLNLGSLKFFSVRLAHIFVCSLLTTASSAQVASVAQPKSDVSQSVEQVQETPSKSNAPDIFDDVTQLERVEPGTTKAIVKNFLAANSLPRKYALNVVSQGYEQNESNPALRLNQMWVGSDGVLLELSGLPRKLSAVSAIMRRDTLRIKGKNGKVSQLLAFEGVTELRDRRGGSALVVNSGDTLYLLFEKFDDFFSSSLLHINRDGRESIYFETIDPRFRERYDTMHNAATTPIAMTNFLMEFSNNDPDQRVLKIFSALVNEMRAKKSFEGHYTVFKLISDPKDYEAMRRTAITPEHKAIIQAIEDEKQAEIRRREEAKLAEQRRQEAGRMEAQRAEEARAAEARCMATPSCRQEIDERRARCVQTVQNCRSQCDRFTGSGEQRSFFGNLAAAGLARACYTGCKCDGGIGDILAKVNQVSAGEVSSSRARNAPDANSTPNRRNEDRANASTAATMSSSPRAGSDAKTFVCTIYCNSSGGPTIRRETLAKSRADAASILGEQADAQCKASGHSKANSARLPENQCSAK